jgi:hypothetical protein
VVQSLISGLHVLNRQELILLSHSSISALAILEMGVS